MIYGYIRVSTDSQTVDNQRIAISDYLVKEHKTVDYWIEDIKSGTVDYHKRNLGELVDKLRGGDTLICTELSRLGRSLTMIFNLMQELIDKKVTVIAIKNNFVMTGDDIVTKVLMFAFGLSAEIERNLISERTKLGLQRAKMNGKQIGHKKGDKLYNIKLRKYQNEIIDKYNSGRSIRSLAIEYSVTWSTMSNFIKYRQYDKK